MKFSVSVTFMLGMIMLAIIMQGINRDGITTWMPSYISETFGIASKASILTGVALPIFSIVCYNLSIFINRKFLKNELSCAAFIFMICILSCGLMYAFGGKSPVLSIILLTLATGSMHGVNVILICIIPPYFRSTGRVSTVSGILNSCTYIGSAISIYGIAVITEKFGWNTTILLWTVVAIIGTVLCTTQIKKWNNFKSKQL